MNAGADTLLNKCGIDYCTITYPEVSASDVILILGSGAFCRPWHHNIERVRFYVAKYRTDCIFPATFDFTFLRVANFIRELPANVIAFCREETSYNALKTIVPGPERVHLDHDAAFHNDVTAWKGAGIIAQLVAFSSYIVSDLWQQSSTFDMLRGWVRMMFLLLDTLALALLLGAGNRTFVLFLTGIAASGLYTFVVGA